mgnify:CR=1 FL=1
MLGLRRGVVCCTGPGGNVVSVCLRPGSRRGERCGACTDCRLYWARDRADDIDADEIAAVNAELVPSVGTCSVMGTASTMALVTEALGMMLPGGATPPAVTAARARIAEETGATQSAARAAGREGRARWGACHCKKKSKPQHTQRAYSIALYT